MNPEPEYPARAQLRQLVALHPLPSLTPELIAKTSIKEDDATSKARATISLLNTALETSNPQLLASCFFPGQAFWKDQLALTYHLRTFTDRDVIVAALLETSALRRISDGRMEMQGAAKFVAVSPTLQFIDCAIVFQTNSPAASCRGRLLFLPVLAGTTVEWKIWVLNTRLGNLDIQPEDEALLSEPRRHLDLGSLDKFETDVFIIGGGNAAAALSARLKALGVESVMAERNAHAGDNWARRYDCLHFHLPTALCDMPYMPYDPDLRGAHYLSRDELVAHLRRYITTLGLNYLTSVQILSTHYSPLTSRWTVRFRTQMGECTATAKHLVLATGIGSQRPNVPVLADRDVYTGIAMHSVEYTSARALVERGVKSVLILGSANTAIDILSDCNAHSLKPTLHVRSPTYILPASYLAHPAGLGFYNVDVAAADTRFLTLPTIIDAQFTQARLRHLASQGAERTRYNALAATGFPVLDSKSEGVLLGHHFIERAGGHYIDTGGADVIVNGGVRMRVGAEAVAFTETGVRFSDGSVEEADAVVFCTGFADTDVRDGAEAILGGRKDKEDSTQTRGQTHVDGVEDACHADGDQLDASDIAARLDATWGVDSEGEIRGMWKRHVAMDNFWVMGGHTQQHRWFSRILALQIRAAIGGVLPPAYRGTPGLKAIMGANNEYLN
ncbi:uncharacterized protein DSM5745_08483 [Aspergillus mulundensis]|uniref:FAD/NAD(P)-binding domain-containing protein n=1 Tax=Aspergillus mulundensis TaxID=1810919 RepID=A0A3D8R3T7_9EURO|nr:hypothetical protein DSM5745_08483 [Aspergillus mulundensis]RDW68723.1 hypothetical protein DSM5745_08483 [Aspergillus mulundensis]